MLSKTRNWLLILALGAVLGACARSAPKLPPHSVSYDEPALDEFARDEKCGALAAELEANKAEAEKLEAAIAANRRSNQTLGYIAGALPPVALATEGNHEEKRRLDALQAQRDRVYAEKRRYSCAGDPSIP